MGEFHKPIYLCSTPSSYALSQTFTLGAERKMDLRPTFGLNDIDPCDNSDKLCLKRENCEGES